MLRTFGFKSGVSFGAILMILLLNSSICYGQTAQMEDVVYLKDGSIIRGTIIELVSGKNLKIETRDGSVFAYTMDKVERFTRESARISVPNNRQFPKKHPVIAFVLSMVIPGGGQLYNDEAGKGATMLGASLFGLALMYTASANEDAYAGPPARLGAVVFLGSVFWSLIDAPISSHRINRKNGLASGYRVSDNIYVDAGLSNIRNQSTPYVRAVLSF